MQPGTVTRPFKAFTLCGCSFGSTKNRGLGPGQPQGPTPPLPTALAPTIRRLRGQPISLLPSGEGQIKTPFILLTYCKGRRATFVEQDATLVVPPSFAEISRHQPLRVGDRQGSHYRPDYGGLPAEIYFRARRFLLAASGSFSQSVDMWAFHQLPTLWTQ